MKVTRVNLFKNEQGELFEKISPSKALDVEALKAVEGEGENEKKFFVVKYKQPKCNEQVS